MGTRKVNHTPAIICTLLALAGSAAFFPAAGADHVALDVCYDYECGTRQPVTLTIDEWSRVQQLFVPPSPSPDAERQRIREAIALFETIVGRYTGTSADLGKNAKGSGMGGQMDCIDESSNTTTYLTLLQDAGLLKWHVVKERIMRRRWLLAEHWSAIIMDKTDNQHYAVDSWHLDNGRPPFIQKLADWLDNKSFAD